MLIADRALAIRPKNASVVQQQATIEAHFSKESNHISETAKMMLLTDEISRKTDVEKGFPQHRVFDVGKRPDSLVWRGAFAIAKAVLGT